LNRIIFEHSSVALDELFYDQMRNAIYTVGLIFVHYLLFVRCLFNIACYVVIFLSQKKTKVSGLNFRDTPHLVYLPVDPGTQKHVAAIFEGWLVNKFKQL